MIQFVDYETDKSELSEYKHLPNTIDEMVILYDEGDLVILVNGVRIFGRQDCGSDFYLTMMTG